MPVVYPGAAVSWLALVVAGAGAVVAAIVGWIFGRRKSRPAGIAVRTPEEIDRTTERILDHRKDSNDAVDAEVAGHISDRHDKFGGGS